MEKDGAKGLMEEACKAAEIEPLTFHELRHSAASRWARQGLSLGEIAQQLGHADVRMTQRYAHLCQQTLANKIRQTQSFFHTTDPSFFRRHKFEVPHPCFCVCSATVPQRKGWVKDYSSTRRDGR
jgi:hypothetical protein